MLETDSFIPSAHPPEDMQTSGQEVIMLFSEDRVLVNPDIDGAQASGTLVPAGALAGKNIGARHFLGLWQGLPCLCAGLGPNFVPPQGFQLVGRRELYGNVPDEVFHTAGFAFQILDWQNHNRFCGRCGAPNENHPEQRALVCAACSNTVWPRVNPAVIVLIHNAARDKALLISAAHFRKWRYSTVAGFVEPGESLEETVHREIAEETGVKVKNIRYFRSQPWPWPSSMMIGFFAEHESGEPVPDGVEVIEARWFAKDDMPSVPGRLSLGRQLIDAFLEERMP